MIRPDDPACLAMYEVSKNRRAHASPILDWAGWLFAVGLTVQTIVSSAFTVAAWFG